MTNFTENEKAILAASVDFFNYGDESEKEDNAVIFDVKDLRDVTGMPVATIKGVVGSLFKKNMFVEFEAPNSKRMEIGITDAGIDAALKFSKEV